MAQADQSAAWRAMSEGGNTLRLAGPLIANNLSIAGMNFADTVMSGRLSARDLAAVAVGSSVWMVVFLLGMGVLMAMSPIAAQNFGAGTHDRVGHSLRQALWIGLALAGLMALVLINAEPILLLVGIEADIVPLTGGYLRAMLFGLPAIFCYLALRFTSEGVGWTRPIMYIALAGLVVNVAGNWVLMYGKFGAPALGAVGCGWASAIAMWTMLLGMGWYVRRTPRYRPFRLFERFDWPHGPSIYAFLALGVPIGVSVVAEAGLFSTVALMMGRLGTEIVAAHQIAINYAATMFMVPLAIHSAITIRVGQAIGRGDPRTARYLGFHGIGICAVVMCVSAIAMLIFRGAIVGFYTSNVQVAAIASSLLFMAAVFQVSDGIQVGAAGALRGCKDTRLPMLLNFFAYWIVGFPLAWYLGLASGRGPQFVWVGFVAGPSVAAVLLTWRFALISRVNTDCSAAPSRP